MSKDVEASARWRRLAAEALEAAVEMTDTEAKTIMLDVASRYERLARYTEARASRKDPDKSQ